MERIDYLSFARKTIGGAFDALRNALIDAALFNVRSDKVAAVLDGVVSPGYVEWRRAVLGLICVTPFGGKDFEDAIDGWRQFHDLSYADAAEIVRRYGVDVATMARELGDSRFPFEELPTSLRGDA